MFYTYLHRRSDSGAIFYVGKGKGLRAYKAEYRNRHWNNIASKHGYAVEICAHWKLEQDALDHEVFLIDTLRSLGYRLANVTNGGDGVSGLKHSEKSRRQMSESAKRARANPEWRANMSQRRSAPEYVELFQARTRTPEALAKSKAYRESPEARARQSAFMKSLCADESYMERRMEKLRHAFSDPEWLANAINNVMTANAKRQRRVVCVETGVVYPSVNEAGRQTGKNPGTISVLCNGKTKRPRDGMNFRFIDDAPTAQHPPAHA